MAGTTLFELVSPERLFFSEQVEMVVVPGSEGDFAAQPGRMPKLATVRPGVIVIFEGGKPKERIFVAGGFAEVTPESCTVLAEEAAVVSDITVRAAEERYDAAHKAQHALFLSMDEEAKAAAANEFTIASAMLAAAKGDYAYR